MKKFSRLPAVLERFPYGRSQLYQLISEGKFPKPVKLGGPNSRAVAWENGELDQYAERLLAERGEAA